MTLGGGGRAGFFDFDEAAAAEPVAAVAVAVAGCLCEKVEAGLGRAGSVEGAAVRAYPGCAGS